jgi:hypothetical protein
MNGFRGAAPRDDSQIGFGRCGASQVRKRADGVVEEHHSEARDDHVEARGLERVRLRVGANEARRRAFAFGALLRERDHRLRDVEADGGALGPELSCDGERRAARAATDVEHAPRFALADGLDEQVLERLEHAVERFLQLDPRSSGGVVPQRDLLFVRAVCRVYDYSPRLCRL